VLAQLLQCPALEVTGVVQSSRVLSPRYGFLRGAWEQLRRSGAAYSLYLWCSTSLSEWLCAHAGSKSVPRLAAARRIPIFRTRNVNDDRGSGFVARLEPDLLLSAFFNQRFSLDLLRIPRIAALNIHPSLLPEFKGVDPVFHARLRKAGRLGVTIHHMAPDLDTGNILMQAEVCVAPSSSVFRATAALFAAGAAMLTSSLEGIVSGDRGTAQPDSGSYDTWPKRDDVRRLRAAGDALIRISDIVAVAAMARDLASPGSTTRR
jgi:methionyl-tRNA formyltransferase